MYLVVGLWLARLAFRQINHIDGQTSKFWEYLFSMCCMFYSLWLYLNLHGTDSAGYGSNWETSEGIDPIPCSAQWRDLRRDDAVLSRRWRPVLYSRAHWDCQYDATVPSTCIWRLQIKRPGPAISIPIILSCLMYILVCGARRSEGGVIFKNV